MPALLKDLYSPSFFNRFGSVLEKTCPGFDYKEFTLQVFNPQWKNLELKERMRHTATVLKQFFPTDFPKAAEVIVRMVDELRYTGFTHASLEFMFIPHYIESNGLDHFEDSTRAFEYITSFTSCEFAVRPFVIKYGDRMVQKMISWSLHENLHVRRLASEGIRPRLPWAIALPVMKHDPSPIFPILENLKTDPAEYVRRSVANNLNDIARDHPGVVIDFAKKWKGIGPETDAIIRHGARTLLKQGNSAILQHFGLDAKQVVLQHFQLENNSVKKSGELQFTFTVENSGKKAQQVRLEYAIYYLRQKGRISKKVFKISERTYLGGEKVTISRKQSFRPITTRKFYPGLHQVALIINGKEYQRQPFYLE